jgi:RNA-directed DNA polymerase
MNAEQQKGTSQPGDGGEGGTPTSTPGPQQTFAAWVSQRALTASLMEQVCDPKNVIRAYRRVRANKGKPGVDGMTVHELMDWLRINQAALTASLLDGTYQPYPVRGAQIRKPGGGQRQLGIPVVVDRLVQQAILQVLEPIFDPTFSPSSYGFRPGRSAHMALEQARQYVNREGREIVVDLDLEKFFDRVNHDILIDRLQKRIGDAGVIRLIRAYLNSGIMDNGVVQQRDQGTPQGGPLSPLLANVLLDEVDKELERRGHCFVRYADDANVYVRSRRAGERVMALLRRLYGRLRLKVNETKSAVASVFGCKFLGYSLWVAAGGVVKRKVAAKPLLAFRHRIRELTRRSGGRSMKEVVERLRSYVQGWKAYFRLAQTPRIWLDLDKWLRHRLRAIQLKHWRRGTTIYRELCALGASAAVARQVAANSRRWWRNSDGALKRVLTIAYFDQLGVPRLS